MLLLALSGLFATVVAQFNNPPGVDTWCGKAYRSTNASFNPGGWLTEPVVSSSPLLDLRIRPRMNLYLPSDAEGSFIIDANISYTNGEPYYNTTNVGSSNTSEPFTILFIDIAIVESGVALVSGANVSINTTNNEIEFSLSEIPDRVDPYTITLVGASQDGNQSYYAETQLYKLPARTDEGSVVRIDSLYGGLQTLQANANSNPTWTSILPYSFYVSWDGWLEHSISNLDSFKAAGYNIIHIVPNAGLPNAAFNFTELGLFLDRTEELGLWVMFDMRWTYQNLTSVTYQVNILKNRPTLLLWYTGDEPDGASDPLNATTLAYNAIKTLDPYHPVSLCLNCYNFHFSSYSAGADILLSDVYPIAINATYSRPWSTPCNVSYGDCGCDDCAGDFEDISTRLELFKQYQLWLGGAPKTTWGVPQAFGNESYWPRYPTPAEEVLMTMLSLNHGARGIVMWDYPTTPDLASVTSQLAAVLTTGELAGYVLGANPVALGVAGEDRVDAAAWMVGSKMLVSLVFLQADDSTADVVVQLPAPASGVSEVLWGSGWTASGQTLTKTGLSALEVDLLVVDVN